MNKECTVADNIRRIAKGRGLKISEVEARANVSIGYLSRLRRRDTMYSLSVEKLFKFADVLGVDAATLLSEPKARQMEYLVQFDTTAFSDLEPTDLWLRAIHEMIDHYLTGGADDVDFHITGSQLRLICDGHIVKTSTIDEEVVHEQ